MSDADTNVTSPSPKEKERFNLQNIPTVQAKVKFFNPAKFFGFVTILDKDGNPLNPPVDAFVSSKVLMKANIDPEKVQPDQILNVKYAPNDKGVAIIFVKRPDQPNYDPPPSPNKETLAASEQISS